MTHTRFTKANLAAHLWEQADKLGQQFEFTDSTGTAQLDHQIGTAMGDRYYSPIERAVAYGQWITLRDMALDLESGLGIQDWRSNA